VRGSEEDEFRPPPAAEGRPRAEETTNMAIRPLDDRIVARPLEAEQKSAGGILLPDTAKEKPQRAKVLAVGQGRLTDDGKRVPLTVKAGDEILYGKYAGTDIKWKGEELKILRENEVLALLDS
jgi:chaperonin GroES